MRAVTFALVTMFFWGIAPIFAKMGLSNVSPGIGLVIRSAIITIILFIWVLISGNWGELVSIDPRSGALIALEGVFASLLGHLAYYYAIKFGEVSRISPLVAGFPLITLILAILFFKEEPSWTKIAGGVLVVAGVFLLKQ